MTKPLIDVLLAEAEQLTIPLFLTRFGFQVKKFDQLATLVSSLKGKKSGLLLIDGEILSQATSVVKEAFFSLANGKGCRVILTGNKVPEHFPFPYDLLEKGLDPLALHAFLCERLKHYSRNHLRVETNLPGLVSRADSCQFCEILDLGTGGAFIRTGTPMTIEEPSIQLHIPLLGLKKELELNSRVVYQVRPCEENNYLQGAGVSFNSQDPETMRFLKEYLIFSLNNEGPAGAFELTTSSVLGSFRSESKKFQGGRERRMAALQ